MTVSSNILSHSYIPAGLMLAESLSNLHFLTAADLVVTLESGAVQVLGTDYEITGNGRTGTGSIRALHAYAPGLLLIITRKTDIIQEAATPPFTPLPSEEIERALDRRTMVEQELSEGLGDLGERAIKLPEGENAGTLVAASGRLGGQKILGFDADTGAPEVQDMPSAFRGDPGPAANSYSSLVALRASPTTNLTALYDGSIWTWTLGDFTGEINDVTRVASDAFAVTVGAWVRSEYRPSRYAEGRMLQLATTAGYLQNNVGNSITHVGDSISHGAYSGNAYTNSWTMACARFVAAEHGNRNIGFMPMEGLYNVAPGLLTPQLVSVAFGGDWGPLHPTFPAPYNYPQGNIGAAAANIINGKSYTVTVIGATLTLDFPSMAEVCRLLYTSRVGGGRFTITVNGVASPSLFTFLDGNGNAAISTVYNVPFNIPVKDNGKGRCIIVLTKATDTNAAEINSTVGLFTADSGLLALSARTAFNNFSQSGRAFSHASTAAIIHMANSKVLSFALGINDQLAVGGLDTDNNDTNFAVFQSKITQLIFYCKEVFFTPVLVSDFIWDAPPTSRTRKELMRLARETGGDYIGYPDDFFPDGHQVISVPPQLNSPLFLFADRSHPGSEFQSTTAGRWGAKMGYMVRSLSVALEYHDWDYPIPITHADFVNYDSNFLRTISRIRQVGKNYQALFNIKHTSGFVPTGTLFTVSTGLPATYRPSLSVIEASRALSFRVDVPSALLAANAIGVIDGPASVDVPSALLAANAIGVIDGPASLFLQAYDSNVDRATFSQTLASEI
jgi:hypothetical protein